MAVQSTLLHHKRPKLQEDETRYWPEEVIQEILVRLPLQSILRFKSICKNWHSLIQSRPFIEFHRAHHLHNDHRDELFFSRNHGKNVVYTTADEPYVVSCLSNSSILTTGALKSQSTKLFDLGMLRRALTADRVSPPLRKIKINYLSGIHVFGPLKNGISCLVAHEYVGSTESRKINDYCKVAFCNLGTKQFNFIPYPFFREGQKVPQLDDMVLFRFDHYFGFCSIESPNGVTLDYKLVVIEENYWRGRFKASVYSQQEGSWHPVYEAIDYHSSSPLLSGWAITQDQNWLPVQALLNGYCHWMVEKKNSAPKQHSILQFDMASVVFGLIPGPPEEEYYPLFQIGRHWRCNVFVLDGCIAATVAVKNKIRYDRIDVWRMMEYGVEASWRKVFSCEINLNDVSRVLGMSFSHANNKVERLFFEHVWKNLMSSDGSGVKSHRSFKQHWACWKPLGLSAFVETLEPVGASVLSFI